ncbi:MAG: COQ9 family protein [Rhodospirillales bacterium]|nr:COQ9 family protein [Rhodospirillales bacterium]
MNKNDSVEIRDQILRQVLPDVAFDGWNWSAVELAARQAGYDAGVASQVFPGKMKDVLDGFADLADREMLQALEGVDPNDLRIRERVRTALMARFEWLLPHREALRLSSQFWLAPTRKPRAVKIVWRSADRIWDWAGDTAKDYNRYTKRGLLSGILVSTMLVFLNDESETLDNTKAFLDRRIENVMQLGKVLHSCKRASS